MAGVPADEPASGISSTSSPAALYQPSLVAMANGAVADDTVLAHQPTRSFVSAGAAGGSAASARGSATSARVIFLLSRAAPRQGRRRAPPPRATARSLASRDGPSAARARR